jgi:hypothetical protein
MDHALIRSGILINSALYLSGCFVAGLVVGSPLAWKAALLTAAICYLCYSAQDAWCQRLAQVLRVLSLLTGTAAGVALLFV